MYIVETALVYGIQDGLSLTLADSTAGPHPKGFAECLEIATATLCRSFDFGFFDSMAQADIHRSEIINDNDF